VTVFQTPISTADRYSACMVNAFIKFGSGFKLVHADRTVIAA
jgi:hypothetical protein